MAYLLQGEQARIRTLTTLLERDLRVATQDFDVRKAMDGYRTAYNSLLSLVLGDATGSWRIVFDMEREIVTKMESLFLRPGIIERAESGLPMPDDLVELFKARQQLLDGMVGM